MKKRIFSALLALTLCLLPATVSAATVSAANASLPDWYFLFAIFKSTDADYEENGAQKHVKQDLSSEDIQILREQIKQFEDFMVESGVMKPHIDIVEIDTPLKELISSGLGPYPTAKYLEPMLTSRGIDLDRYDHVTAYANMDTVKTGYAALTTTSAPFENGTTYSFVKAERSVSYVNSRTPLRAAYIIVHEFLHTMESRCGTFELHAIEDDIVPGYQSDEKYGACMLDIIHGRIKGEHGPGVELDAWLYPPCVLRTIREITFSDNVFTIKSYQFKNCASLERVVIPSSVTSIKDHAFQFCTGLTEVILPAGITTIEEGAFEQCTSLPRITIPSGVTRIGTWAFESCTSLKEITIPVSVTSIENTAFQRTGLTDVYYEGTEEQWKAIKIGDYNYVLTRATIHYNSPMPGQPATPTPTPTASPSPQTVLVDGKKTDFAMYALNDGAVNYIRVRDLAVILNGTAAQFNVGYDEAADRVILTGRTAYQGATDKAPFNTDMVYTNYTAPTYVNGKAVNLEAIQIEYNGGGYTYYKLRDLGQALGFNVGYDTATDTVFIETDKPYDPNN